jgi:hypothetical protein
LIYRPQFAYPTPPGFRDQEFQFFYDSSILPQLDPQIGDPNPILSLPLTVDPDAPFYWRGVKINNPLLGNYGLRFRDPFGNYLACSALNGNNSPTPTSDDFVPAWLAYVIPSPSSLAGGMPCIHEPEICCPAKSVVFVDLFSFDSVPWTTGGPKGIFLCGVKRYDERACGCNEECAA